MTTAASIASPNVVWRLAPSGWLLLFAALAGIIASFLSPLEALVKVWETQEEYSFGYLVPLIAAFLIWQRKDVLETMRLEGAWTGFWLVCAGLAVGALGRLSTLDTVAQYGFLATLIGLALSGFGWRGARLMLPALAVLCFMVPLPNYLLRELSASLQLMSSQLGVWMIRLFDISVYLEGNVIDLGIMKLQVVEACSGLRYLLPLLTLAFIASCFFRVALWKRAVLVLSAVPITVLMNSARIALIGITAQHFGKAAAEGFVHDFEGWAVFMACMATMFAEMWLLARIGGDARPFREVFGLEFPMPTPSGAARRVLPVPRPFIASGVLILGVASAAAILPEPASVAPARTPFAQFPLEFEGWTGRTEPLAKVYLDELKLDDYLLGNYVDGRFRTVNVYVAYYDSQRDGNSAHSPRACLPGDGWEMQSFEQIEVPGAVFRGQPLRVNRVMIQKGEARQLVYYWFQQRGRNITGEYAVKLHIFSDLLLKKRSDGAMVRLVTALRPGEGLDRADARLSEFAAHLTGRLAPHVPE